MSGQELMITAIIGGVFVLLGIIAFLWSRKEEGDWYGSVSKKVDVREFLERQPGRTEHHALRIGGKILIAVGIVVLLFALGFYIFG
ncbi:MAG TPA: hypothetical protein VLH15_03940 [Dehalococcoidales bacterium]|nr:hypothetical protein [Dehalococcoidales bacterium]